MDLFSAQDLFLVLAAALIGGVFARLLKFQPLVGYILAGITFGSILRAKASGVSNFAEIGTILLLFSIGVELSFQRLGRVFKVATIGAVLQMVFVTVFAFIILSALGIGSLASFVLAMGFSLSSTAVVVKILSDKGENDTLHGELMVGWLLVQDLAVIPMMVILPTLAAGGSILGPISLSLVKAVAVVAGTVVLGKLVAPFLIHKVATTNSRELLVVAAVALALGTAYLASLFGISPALGAFLAGVVISETQENHAVFAETRPLRDLFLALFFVTLGFLTVPGIILSKLPLILALTLIVVLIKIITIFLLLLPLGYKGKTLVATSLGLAQVGEFAFVIFLASGKLGIFSEEITTVGIAVTLLTLLATPFLFKFVLPLWRKLKVIKFFSGTMSLPKERSLDLENHIIICGYGRVGKWIGRALETIDVSFVVIDYNQQVIKEALDRGIPAIYGDPAEPEVLAQANLDSAKSIVVAIPDRITHEELIAHIQTSAPQVKIISRVHYDEDVDKLRLLKVDSIVQPEFEAAVAIARSILESMGKPKEEVAQKIKSLRLSRAMTK